MPKQLQVRVLRSLQEIEPIQHLWDNLAAGNPFLKTNWLLAWWKHFGHQCQLLVLVVADENDETIGIAPWFIERNLVCGRVIKFLGSGRVCSDYQTILCAHNRYVEVVNELARWLVRSNCDPTLELAASERWDSLDFEWIQADDPIINRLIENLRENGCLAVSCSEPNCWRISIADSWIRQIAPLKKSYRQKLRMLNRRYVDSGRAVIRFADTESEVDETINHLIQLHQRRQESKGEVGCFEHVNFQDFLKDTADRFRRQGKLVLAETRIDGLLAAASIGFVEDNVHFVYQCGMNHKLHKLQPGWIMNAFLIQHGIQNGLTSIDYLRGDEPYKRYLGGVPVQGHRIKVTVNSTFGKIRNALWLGGVAGVFKSSSKDITVTEL